jgi:hypothetical protein
MGGEGRIVAASPLVQPIPLHGKRSPPLWICVLSVDWSNCPSGGTVGGKSVHLGAMMADPCFVLGQG